MTPLYVIRNWNEIYENNRSRTLREMNWLPIPNRHNGEAFLIIMEREDSAQIFSAWILMLQVASQCSPRGQLIKKDGNPHTAESLALRTKGRKEWFETAIQFLQTPAIRWIEVYGTSGRPAAPAPRREPPAFEPPRVESVIAQAFEWGIPKPHAEEFWHHYQANGWRIGGNKMRSWPDALRGWQLRRDNKPVTSLEPRSIREIDSCIRDLEKHLNVLKGRKIPNPDRSSPQIYIHTDDVIRAIQQTAQKIESLKAIKRGIRV